MAPNLWHLYRLMYSSRKFEEAVVRLWQQGKISGEMHTSIGEEGIVAGVVVQLQEGDALALDHRGTAPCIMRGLDPILLLREFLGHPEGLCVGMGGHMHLFSKEHLLASSGIVGASGPAAVGFALAAQQLRPGAVAAAFFGEGAANQGMLMEAMNLAVAWRLPVLFVCKDNDMAITTPSHAVTGGTLTERARGFGMLAVEVDGRDVEAVWGAAAMALARARTGNMPAFLHATCVRPDGHFLGDPLLRLTRHPLQEMKAATGPLLKSLFKLQGAPLRARAESLKAVTRLVEQATKMKATAQSDPVRRLRRKLEADADRLQELEREIDEDVAGTVDAALAG